MPTPNVRADLRSPVGRACTATAVPGVRVRSRCIALRPAREQALRCFLELHAAPSGGWTDAFLRALARCQSRMRWRCHSSDMTPWPKSDAMPNVSLRARKLGYTVHPILSVMLELRPQGDRGWEVEGVAKQRIAIAPPAVGITRCSTAAVLLAFPLRLARRSRRPAPRPSRASSLFRAPSRCNAPVKPAGCGLPGSIRRSARVIACSRQREPRGGVPLPRNAGAARPELLADTHHHR